MGFNYAEKVALPSLQVPPPTASQMFFKIGWPSPSCPGGYIFTLVNIYNTRLSHSVKSFVLTKYECINKSEINNFSLNMQVLGVISGWLKHKSIIALLRYRNL